MAVYRGPVCRLCRREHEKLFLKGDRCFTEKCAIERRNVVPGQHGMLRRRQASEYGTQLREKQKTKRSYGVLEKQFRGYFEEAAHAKGVTGENLLQLLEMRLDNIVYRMGFAPNRNLSRQLVRHGHFRVNGRKASIPSIRLKVGDVVEVMDNSRSLAAIQAALAGASRRTEVEWVSVDKVKFAGRVLSQPARTQIPTPVNEQLIVELYSK
ncbi:MAG: 30S ribosomal protein S4 [Fibrobacterota bacterium]|nr:30S ribosomal protein S4 [Fibrobacterota bacterium]QQS06878.1 MAG: 30S ribosomal protein S4 [Fibrobacterota bacterium]